MSTSKMYFAAMDGAGGYDLWVTDGTTTEPVSGLNNNAGVIGAYDDGLDPSLITRLGDEIIFSGYDSGYDANVISPDNYPNLWISDGTSNGTIEIGGVSPGSASGASSQIADGSPNGLDPASTSSTGTNSDFVVIGNEAIFSGTNAAGDDDLWVTNGTTSGTVEIGGTNNSQVFNIGANWDPQNLGAFSNRALFDATDASAGNSYVGLWITDGAGVGTTEIGGLQNAGIFDHAIASFAAQNAIALGNLVFFTAPNATGDNAIWVTDGSAAGTFELGGVDNAAIVGAAANLGNDFGGAVQFGNRILFQGVDQNNAVGLFTTDLTTNGAYEIGGLADAALTNSGQSPNSNGLNPTDLAVNGDEVLFNGVDGSGQRNLWITKGTALTTVELSGVNDEDATGLNPTSIVSLGNGTAVFIGSDKDGTETLWETNGTVAGTKEIGGLSNQAIAGISPLGFEFSSTLVAGAGIAYFDGYSNNLVPQLWETDGTLSGTKIVSPTTGSAFDNALNASDMTIVDNTVPNNQYVGGGYTLTPNLLSVGCVNLYNTTDGNYDSLSCSNATISLNNAVAAIVGGGETVTLNGSSTDFANLYNTNGNDDYITGSNGRIGLNDAVAAIVGGGDLILLDGSSKDVAGLYDTDGSYDSIIGSHGTIALNNAVTAIVGGGETVTLNGSSTNFANLYNTNGSFDSVIGSDGMIGINNAAVTITGSSDVVLLDGSSTDSVKLYNTNGSYDNVLGSNGTIGLNNSVAAIVGSNETVTLNGSSTNFANLYNTNGSDDHVTGSNGMIGLNNAGANIIGGGDQVSMDGTSTDFANLYNTNGTYDSVVGSHGTIGLNNAVAAIVGGGDRVLMDGSAADFANLYNTNGSYDSVLGSNGTIGLNDAVAAIVGGDDRVLMDGSAADFANLYNTNGKIDQISGSHGTIGFNDASATVNGNDDNLYFSGGNDAVSIKGTGETLVFSTVFGMSSISGFSSSDTLCFSIHDFANFNALKLHTSGGNIIITLDASDVLTIVGVTNITANQCHFS